MAEENKIPEVELDTDGVQEQSIEVNQEVKEPEVTEIKKGLKENTLVATVNSHTHNVPTLLIEHT